MGCCLSVVRFGALAVATVLTGYILLTLSVWIALVAYSVYVAYSRSPTWTPGLVVDVGIASGVPHAVDFYFWFIVGLVLSLLGLAFIHGYFILRDWLVKNELGESILSADKVSYGTV